MIRVLIVEDDKLSRQGLMTAMPWEKHGMRVVGEAANGQKALQFLQKEPADLCFVDLMMPVMGGLEFIAATRDSYPLMDYVVVSFQEDFAAVQNALRMGVLDYISKLEFEHADLDQVLRRIAVKLDKDKLAPQANPFAAAWEQELSLRRWLYDAQALDTLMEDVALKSTALGALEHALIKELYAIEEEAGFQHISVPKLQSVDHLSRFLRHFRNQALLQASESKDCVRVMTCLLKAVAMVEDDCARDLHTERVASDIGLSRPYFSQCFSREVGLPFNAFLRRERVARACALLRQSDLPVAQVANRVGYEDLRSFIKLFLEQTGQTPAEYRQRG